MSALVEKLFSFPLSLLLGGEVVRLNLPVFMPMGRGARSGLKSSQPDQRSGFMSLWNRDLPEAHLPAHSPANNLLHLLLSTVIYFQGWSVSYSHQLMANSISNL